MPAAPLTLPCVVWPVASSGAVALVVHLVPRHDDAHQLAVREDAQGVGPAIAAGPAPPYTPPSSHPGQAGKGETFFSRWQNTCIYLCACAAVAMGHDLSRRHARRRGMWSGEEPGTARTRHHGRRGGPTDHRRPSHFRTHAGLYAPSLCSTVPASDLVASLWVCRASRSVSCAWTWGWRMPRCSVGPRSTPRATTWSSSTDSSSGATRLHKTRRPSF